MVLFIFRSVSFKLFAKSVALDVNIGRQAGPNVFIETDHNKVVVSLKQHHIVFLLQL